MPLLIGRYLSPDFLSKLCVGRRNNVISGLACEATSQLNDMNLQPWTCVFYMIAKPLLSCIVLKQWIQSIASFQWPKQRECSMAHLHSSQNTQYIYILYIYIIYITGYSISITSVARKGCLAVCQESASDMTSPGIGIVWHEEPMVCSQHGQFFMFLTFHMLSIKDCLGWWL